MTDKEFKFWAENYPEQAEAIVTLCDLFDAAHDEATKAVLSYTIGVLREKEDNKKKMKVDNEKQTQKILYCPFRKETYTTAFGYGGSNDNYPSETKTYEEFLPCIGEQCMLFSSWRDTCALCIKFR